MNSTITEFAAAKINLALHVLGRRADGYHELDSIVAFADVGDLLKIAPSTEFSIEASGPFAGGLPAAEDDIIHEAWLLARGIAQARGRVVPPVRIGLEKNLPIASGIGGGSADAAAALRGCLSLAGIAVDDEIRTLALKLGADVPVCLGSRACRMRGVGERLTLLEGFAPRPVLLVNPGVAVSTPETFRRLGLAPGQCHGTAIADTGNPLSWRNDLAAPAIAAAPVIADVLSALRVLPGVANAGMSGSGASCFAVFDAEPSPDVARRLPARWWRAFATLA